MRITLTPEQESSLQVYVEGGRFASVEAAVRQLIDVGLMELDAETDDLAWAKPLVDEAREAVSRGEVVTIEEHRAHIAKLLSTLEK
jgi:antitoxin ParD1/3/4